jgi:hypothetical protein
MHHDIEHAMAAVAKWQTLAEATEAARVANAETFAALCDRVGILLATGDKAGAQRALADAAKMLRGDVRTKKAGHCPAFPHRLIDMNP